MLTVQNISYAYAGGVRALERVSFTLLDGESAALLGANGAGKSTLLSLLCGLVLPAEGSVYYDNLPLCKENLPQVRARVGMVFQNPDDQLFMPTVYDDVAFGLRNQGMDEAAVRARVMHTLSHLGVEGLFERPPYRLSGGEKRLCAMATVLAMKPKLLLFDEPTAFLDARARRGMMALLPTISAGKLIVTHDLALARATCTRALVLEAGMLLRDGPIEDILSDQAFLEEAGL